MEKIRLQIVENCQRCLSDYYRHEKNGAKWKDELQQSKCKLQDHARHLANELLRKKEKEAVDIDITPEFSNHEIENKFQEYWDSVKDVFNSKKEKTFVIDNVPLKFANEIGLKYGYVASFRKVYNNFGMYLQNKFKIGWVKLSNVEPIITNVTSRIYRKHFGFGIADTDFFQNMQDLVATTESKLLHDVIGLYDVAGLIKMQFHSDSAIFDCGSLVKQYLAKAIDLLVKNTRRILPEKILQFDRHV